MSNFEPLLAGKIAVVTGANRGIGRHIAELFRSHGADVIACIRTIDDDVRTWADEHGITPVPLDLKDEAQIKEAVKQIRAISKSIHILVNNAGVPSGGLFQMMPIAELRAVFDVNFFGPLQFTQGLVRAMRGGSIINITSIAAHSAHPGTLAYGCSKAALARATQSMATELGAQGIRVNAIAPGVTQTDMLEKMDQKAIDLLVAASANKRVATPQDIGSVALFLASEMSSHVTGQTIRVDGGVV